MAKGKNILTTGDVAKICNVAPRTVSKWFDSGQLKGYRIPGSKDRRIPLNELLKFMKANNMPLDALPVGKIRVLVVDSNNEDALSLAETLADKGEYETQTVSNNFETGVVAQKFAPHVILIDLSSDDIEPQEICNYIRSDQELSTIKVLAIDNNLSDEEADSLTQKGFDGYIKSTENLTDVIRKIEQATSILN